MKQTAIDKLIEYFIKEEKQGCSHWCIHDLIAQLYLSKEMEKEQMRKAYLADAYNSQYGFEQYYNETYEQDKQG